MEAQVRRRRSRSEDLRGRKAGRPDQAVRPERSAVPTGLDGDHEAVSLPTFDLQPTLKGDRVTLRPMRAEDFDALFLAASDPLIWEQHPEHDRYTEAKFRRYFQGGLDSGGALVVIDNATGRVIGSTRYCGY